ncbi:hypothetical protein A3I99_04765 [Candidatus Kaiserbacteria bacterium RIFCSPLOWO2_02_FULL_45_11b]|uniref:Uncharacterized protein n=1 Tax=Candidatus Kaiserbacteria bacterium RIFCSPLOWO2_12_FULL_45_26 TaxID=1798525 RepID=A0A1F6FGU5_9BACT|nr:MAG: hypothetical protein A2929_00440 [Candidatus Kaiserbacteria bacterium RIFCSPLOWO2_01_FULL_45_25]OGG81489.1 MAG: hypothetical protein A3I99_04765 [Candidatus Kaiserbacteria bacterium RIFCSPLOWO2_02_FULL_45_11b]OGG85078.1 MAG: hypothetical protein A3G90_03390 [Candidatus Kaiserbacteria bacterium RIFCSPLOWO2_12_FULL_45_26]
MIDQYCAKTESGVEFHIRIEDIKPSERSPNECFRVLWSVTEGKQTVRASFTVKFTDPLFLTHKITPYRDTEENKIVPARDIASTFLNSVVVFEYDRDIDTTAEIFFAERPDGTGRFDGHIFWSHKGDFYSF